MITVATGQPIRIRLAPAEVRENEVRPGDGQGPIPACLIAGYIPPPAVVRLPDPVPESPTTCAPVALQRQSRPGHPKLPPSSCPRPLDDPEARRRAVAEQLAGGVWRTAWEIAREINQHPEVVRSTLHSLRAVSRPVAQDQIKSRGALIEYAAEGTQGVPAVQPRRRSLSGRWTHAFCEVCETPREFIQAPAEGGTDLVCSTCSSVIATLYHGAPNSSGVAKRET